VSTLIVPKLRESVQNILDNALKGNETSNYVRVGVPYQEQRYPLSVGERHDMPIDAEYNIVGRVVGVAQDLTKLQSTTALWLPWLVSFVGLSILQTLGIDIHWNGNKWNDKTSEITGFTKTEAFSKPLISTFIVLKLQKLVQEILDNALRGDETSNREPKFRTKWNQIRYLLVNATTRRDAKNNVVGVVGVAQGVTEAAKHDRAVAAMARELCQLVDTANAPMIIHNILRDSNFL
jgi:PAS domain S-box-containing protein